MKKILKIFKYCTYDMLRSRWFLIYTSFFVITCFALYYFTGDTNRTILSLMNIVLFIIPLISTIYTIMYYYSSREFILLLLSQPIKRQTIIYGFYLGISATLSISFIAGFIIPSIFLGEVTENINSLIILIISGIFLSFIYTGISLLIALLNDDKIKGFGISILFWLLTALLYDGIILLILVMFNEYPLERPSLLLTIANPVDLSRIMILLNMDTASLLGYTGAVFKKFFGTTYGILISFSSLCLWLIIPLFFLRKVILKKDF